MNSSGGTGAAILEGLFADTFFAMMRLKVKCTNIAKANKF